MNISSASGASIQSTSTSSTVKTLEAKQQKIKNEIKQLQKRDADV